MGLNFDILSFLAGIVGGVFSNVVFEWAKGTILKIRGVFVISKPDFIKAPLKPGLTAAKQLEQMQALLGYIGEWLMTIDTIVIQQVRKDLWIITNHLTIQQYAFIVLYSSHVEDQVLAIKKLALVGNDKYIIQILRSFCTNPAVSEDIKSIANGILEKKRNLKNHNSSRPVN